MFQARVTKKIKEKMVSYIKIPRMSLITFSFNLKHQLFNKCRIIVVCFWWQNNSYVYNSFVSSLFLSDQVKIFFTFSFDEIRIYKIPFCYIVLSIFVIIFLSSFSFYFQIKSWAVNRKLQTKQIITIHKVASNCN